jgi:CRISPR system Cascade subunit CasA
MVVVSVLRLLEAVLLSSCEIEGEDRWLDLWAAGRFEAKIIASIFERCGGRLDLFDERRPFYQSSDVPASAEAGRSKSVGYLFAEAATGTGVTHYAHAPDASHAFCPVCCAKGLVMLPAFATSGGQGIKPSINGVPPTYVFALGESVFATLLLNYILPSFRPPMASISDPGPFWASDGIVPHKDERASAGFIESLTWQPRRVRLLAPFGAGTCSWCGRPSEQLTRRIVLDQGASRLKEAVPWTDPWAAYLWRTDKVGATTVRPLRPQEERQCWRDIGALFLSQVPAAEASARGHSVRPQVVSQTAALTRVIGQEGLHETASDHFLAVGLRTDMKAKVFECRMDRFELPDAVLGRAAAVPVTRALRITEAAAEALGSALLRLHAATERENPSWPDVRSAMAEVIRLAQRRFWSKLEPEFRLRLFDGRLAGDEEAQAAWLSEWGQLAKAAVVEALEGALAASDDTAAGLRRQETSRHVLYVQLKKEGIQ